MKKLLIPVLLGVPALALSPLTASAAVVEVAAWGSTAPGGVTNRDANVSGCVYGGVTFSCSSVTAAAGGTQCNYVALSLTGICSVNLVNGSIVNGAYVGAAGPTAAVCDHGVGTNDGGGEIDFQPLSGGGTPEAVPVTFHIVAPNTTVTFPGQQVTVWVGEKPITVDLGPVTVTSAANPTVFYTGTNVDPLGQGLVHVDGTFSFVCGNGSSQGTFGGELS
ncbi:MAG TPA: hypothetical protein VN193_13480 [Candidatus Angelobacter sp.]|nr:hypothetical protein [Candidatus Angelobacter sp.]